MNTPTFRSDLEIIKRQVRGESARYLIRDDRSQASLEVGEEEYFLLQHMDGASSLTVIRARFEQRFNLALPLHNLKAFVHQLYLGGFLSDNPSPVIKDHAPWIPYWELPIGWATRVCRRLAARLSRRIKTAYTVCAIALITIASAIFVANGGPLISSMRSIWTLTPMHVVYGLMIAYAFLNIPHEFAHGITCAHFRGRIEEMGLRFYFNIVPVFYCKFTDVFWMKSKSARIQTWFAGGFYELLVLSIGIIGWRLNPSGSVANDFFLAVATVACAATLFNMIPLLNRDGYYMMTAALEIRELRKRAFDTAMAWLFRRPPPEPLSSGQRLGFWTYTLLAVPYTYIPFVAWKVAVQLCQSLQGAGALLVVGISIFAFQRPIHRAYSWTQTTMSWLFNFRVGVTRQKLIWYAVMLGFVLLMLVPYPYDTGGAFRFVPFQQAEVRPQVDGEVTAVFITEGQRIHAGDKLATLNRRIHEDALNQTQQQLDHERSLLQVLKVGPKPEDIEKAQQAVRTAKVRLVYSSREAKRIAQLFKQKVVSEQAYDDAKKQEDMSAEGVAQAEANLALIKTGAKPDSIAAAEAEVRRLESQVAHLEKNLDLTTLVSPIDGVVTTPYLNERLGHYLKEGEVFAVIQDQHIIQTEVEVPETYIGDVQIGAKARIRMWAYPWRMFTGEVASIAPIATGQFDNRVIRVLINVPNPDGLLRPDMTGYVKIDSAWRPVGIVLSTMLVRFFMVQVWYWIP